MKLKRILCLCLALVMLFSIACAKEESKATETAEKEQSSQGEAGKLSQADEKFLKQFADDYFDGEYDDKRFFAYDDLSQYFSLASYEGIHYPDDALLTESVTDQEVEDYITQIFLASVVSDDQYTELTEGVIQRYDMLTLDYKGIIDGKEVEKATATGQTLLIGSNSFIKGFEEALIGKKVGEEIVLNLKFSPYYQADEVKGKDVTFHVTVHKIQRPTLPEFTVDVINEAFSTSLKDMDKARAWIKEMLNSQAENNAFSYLATFLQDDILSRSRVKMYPQKELDHFISHYKGYYEQYLEEGQTLETFCQESLGLTYDEFIKDAQEYAKQEVGVKLMLYAIADKEEISCTKEQLISLIRGLYVSENDGYYGSLESMVTDYVNIYGADYFENQVIATAVMEVVSSTAVKEAA